MVSAVAGRHRGVKTPMVDVLSSPGAVAYASRATAVGASGQGTSNGQGVREEFPAKRTRLILAERTLVLNVTFQPLSITTVRRALLLVLAGKADVIHKRPGVVRPRCPTLPILRKSS